MGLTWDARSRLTRKRQKTRREEGRPRVSNLGLIIRDIQREAAALPTDALRHEIEINLEVQDAAINLYNAIRPGGRTVEDLIVVHSAVIVSVLTTALYVQELTTRSAVHRAVVISPN